MATIEEVSQRIQNEDDLRRAINLILNKYGDSEQARRSITRLCVLLIQRGQKERQALCQKIVFDALAKSPEGRLSLEEEVSNGKN